MKGSTIAILGGLAVVLLWPKLKTLGQTQGEVATDSWAVAIANAKTQDEIDAIGASIALAYQNGEITEDQFNLLTGLVVAWSPPISSNYTHIRYMRGDYEIPELYTSTDDFGGIVRYDLLPIARR